METLVIQQIQHDVHVSKALFLLGHRSGLKTVMVETRFTYVKMDCYTKRLYIIVTLKRMDSPNLDLDFRWLQKVSNSTSKF